MKTGYCSNCKMITKLSSGSHWYIYFILWITSPIWIIAGTSILTWLFYWLTLGKITTPIFLFLGIMILVPIVITILLLVHFSSNKEWYCSKCKIKGTIIEKPINK